MNKLIQLVCGIGFLAVFLPASCTTFVEPDQIGIRQGLTGGVVEEDFIQERVMDIPVLHTVHFLPRTVQFQHYTRSTGNPLILRTKGNNDITVDVSVQYRIKEGEAWQIVHEGLQNSWQTKVDSACRGFLRDHLAQLTNEDVQQPEKKEEVAASAVNPLGKMVAQYHVEVLAVNLRDVGFSDQYEAKLMEKQTLVVMAELDRAKQEESAAIQATNTVEQGIQKDRKIEAQVWRGKIETLRNEYEIKIAEVAAEATKYAEEKKAETDALCADAEATGRLAEATAVALGEKLRAQALATPAGNTYTAIQAAQNFQLGDVQLNSADPGFLQDFGSMDAWRLFFTASMR